MRPRGFTLIELMVVLAILAAATTVALRYTTKLQDRNRFDATQRILEEVEAAVIGDPAQRFGAASSASFVADMGRLPNDLRELWEHPVGPHELPVQASSLQTSEDDPDVVIQAGWRGPYVLLPPGSKENDHEYQGPVFRDGYGTPLQLVTDGLTGWAVASWGPDGQETPGDNLSVVILGPGPPAVDRVHAALGGVITLTGSEPVPGAAESMWDVTVVVYGPDAEDGGVEGFEAPAEKLATDGSSWSYAFPPNALTIGPRTVRAYVHGKGTTPQATAMRSDIRRIKLLPGGNLLDFEVEASLGGLDVGDGKGKTQGL